MYAMLSSFPPALLYHPVFFIQHLSLQFASIRWTSSPAHSFVFLRSNTQLRTHLSFATFLHVLHLIDSLYENYHTYSIVFCLSLFVYHHCRLV